MTNSDDTSATGRTPEAAIAATPEVSVIVPVGRIDDDLPRQLEALASQDFTGEWELIISLNTPSELERQRLDALLQRESFARVLVVDSSDMRSASHARNAGASNASAELLAFCDGDDVADEGWLSAIVTALGKYDVVGGHLDETLLEIEGQQHWRPPATPGSLPKFLNVPYLVSANMGMYRKHFEKSGGFDTSLIRCEDVDFSWNLIEDDLELTYIADAIIHYRHRRGMWPMMRQHYLYGRGFSQLLERRSVPGGEKLSGLSALKPNNQKVQKKTLAYYLRRGSIAAGRVAGLIEHRLIHRANRR